MWTPQNAKDMHWQNSKTIKRGCGFDDGLTTQMLRHIATKSSIALSYSSMSKNPTVHLGPTKTHSSESIEIHLT